MCTGGGLAGGSRGLSGRKQRSLLGFAQLQRLRQAAYRGGTRRTSQTTLEVGDAALAQPRTLRQFLLRQAGGQPILMQQSPEGPRFAGHALREGTGAAAGANAERSPVLGPKATISNCRRARRSLPPPDRRA